MTDKEYKENKQKMIDETREYKSMLIDHILEFTGMYTRAELEKMSIRTLERIHDYC